MRPPLGPTIVGKECLGGGEVSSRIVGKGGKQRIVCVPCGEKYRKGENYKRKEVKKGGWKFFFFFRVCGGNVEMKKTECGGRKRGKSLVWRRIQRTIFYMNEENATKLYMWKIEQNEI